MWEVLSCFGALAVVFIGPTKSLTSFCRLVYLKASIESFASESLAG